MTASPGRDAEVCVDEFQGGHQPVAEAVLGQGPVAHVLQDQAHGRRGRVRTVPLADEVHGVGQGRG
jgi:hypothetical protein